MKTITGGGVLSRNNVSDLNSNFSLLGALAFTPGNVIYLNPSATGVQTQDGSLEKPFTSIASAYAAGRNGKNDVIVLVGNGAASGSARLSSGFTWAKDALHLVGVAAPGMFSLRARIAPTLAVTAFANFFTVSGNGCFFQNIQWFQGFDTGTTAQICLTVTGQRNVFQSCAITGMGDAASAQDAGSRNLKVSGGENLFQDCTIGDDAVARTVANASIELAGAAARNVFRRSIVNTFATNSGVLTILGTGAGCVDRITVCEDCSFLNSIKSGSGTTMTALGSFTSAAPGGLVAFRRCMSVGATKYGDANFLANSYIDMAAPSSAAGGLAVNPA